MVTSCFNCSGKASSRLDALGFAGCDSAMAFPDMGCKGSFCVRQFLLIHPRLIALSSSKLTSWAGFL